jgi:SAM-dependent methyltransferase
MEMGLLVRFVKRSQSFINLNLEKRIHRDFVSHPDTDPARTNAELGFGNGHARSNDLYLLFPILLLLRMQGIKSVIDLGSGDGYALRIFEYLNYEEIVGVELDTSLHEIALQNLSKSKLINDDFRNIGTWYESNEIELVYIFNPAAESVVINAVEVLLKHDIKYLLCKNFVINMERSEALGLSAKRINKNYLLYRVN